MVTDRIPFEEEAVKAYLRGLHVQAGEWAEKARTANNPVLLCALASRQTTLDDIAAALFGEAISPERATAKGGGVQ